MAKRVLTGQLNLFDFWGDTNSEDSIVEMVPLAPEEHRPEMVPLALKEDGAETAAPAPEETVFERVMPETLLGRKMPEEMPAQDVEEEPEVLPAQDAPVMHREICDKQGNVVAELSYLNYNKVFIKNSRYRQGKLFTFENSREAVDFYITEMMKLAEEEGD